MTEPNGRVSRVLSCGAVGSGAPVEEQASAEAVLDRRRTSIEETRLFVPAPGMLETVGFLGSRLDPATETQFQRLISSG